MEVLDSACAELSQLNPYRYRGYYYDTETGLYFLKTRYYDPEIGRFITIDDLSYIDPEIINGLNLYAYCTNNPVMNIDPNGTWSWKKFWKKTVGWVATAAIAIAGVALVVGTVAALAVGTMATGGILPAVLIGVGLGAVAGVGMGIANQGGLSNIKNMNPWKVAGAGFVGSIVGGISGAMGAVVGEVGAFYGSLAGHALSGMPILSTIATKSLISTFTVVGSMLGKAVGGYFGASFVNRLGDDMMNSLFQHDAENPSWLKTLILQIFKFIRG